MVNSEEPSTKVGDENTEAQAQAEDASLLSLESLDDVLMEADPEFASGLIEIGPDDPSAMYIYDPDLELTQTLEDEIRSWEHSTGLQKLIYKIFPFLPKLIFKSRSFKGTLLEKRVKLEDKIRHFRKNGPREMLAFVKHTKTSAVQAVSGSINSLLTTFKSFSLVKKILFVTLILITGASAALIYRISTKGLIAKSEGLFMTSMQDWSQKSIVYDPATESEAFYDSLRASQNILSLEKMIVNLRPSESSGSNPMGAFEFYVEGMAADVIVEIKDREPEMRDLFQRTIEESTFDFIASGEGKQQLTEKLRKEVNKILTTGRVRRIFIKTAIIKP